MRNSVRACLFDRAGPFQCRWRSYQYHAYGDQLMALSLNPNDCARTAQPSLWIFQGPAVGLLVVGVMFFVCLMLVLSCLGVDWIPTNVISALPLGAITILIEKLSRANSAHFGKRRATSIRSSNLRRLQLLQLIHVDAY